jgi:hypothetical protein
MVVVEMRWKVVKQGRVLESGRLFIFPCFYAIVDSQGNVSTGETIREAVTKYLEMLGKSELAEAVNNRVALIEVA